MGELMTQRVGYGFEPDLPGFADLTPAAAGRRLRAAGCTGVFMHGADRAWAEGLHAAGVRLYESFSVFAGADVWARFPESRPVTAEGAPAPQEEWYIPAIPTLPALRAHRLRALEAALQAAPLDGLWLDFIRWPARWERAQPRLYHSSFDPVTLRQFQADAGVALPETAATPAGAAAWILAHAAEAWFRWRCEQIATFVAEARVLLHRHRPGALLGMFVVPWTADDHDGALVRVVGQDLSLLAEHVDVFSPMVYHRLCGRDPAWVGRVTAWVRGRSGRTVWPIIEALEAAEAYPRAEFAAACREAVSASGAGVMVFKLAGVLSDPARVEAWRAL